MNPKNWLHYYRNSLADGEQKALSTSEIEKNSIAIGSSGSVEESTVQEFYRRADLDIEDGIPLSVFISPFYLVEEKIHNKGQGRRLYPYWYSAVLTSERKLHPPTKENLTLPFFGRDFLEPAAAHLDSLVFSSIEEVDSLNASIEQSYDSWGSYQQFINRYYEKLCGYLMDDFKREDYAYHKKWHMRLSTAKGMADGILSAYDQLLKKDKLPALLLNILQKLNQSEKKTHIESVDETFIRLSLQHLGQMNREYPLSPSQRATLYHQPAKHNVLAVNGPPGTGKTTLLQSVVANLMVEKACKGEKPPLIAACSTNNQAITNILASFGTFTGDHPLAERWINLPASLGIYMTSAYGQGEKDNYIRLNSRDYCDGYLPDQEAYRTSLSLFKDKFSSFFKEDGETSIQIMEKRISGELTQKKENLECILLQADDLADKFGVIKEATWTEFLSHCQLTQKDNDKILKSDEEQFNSFQQDYNSYKKTESFIIRMLSFFPRVDRKRYSQFSNQYFKYSELIQKAQTDRFSEIPSVMPSIHQELNQRKKAVLVQKSLLDDFIALITELSRNHPKVLLILDNKNLPWSQSIAEALDVSLRYILFLLAIYFYELRWLKAVEEEITGKSNKRYNKGEKGKINSFRLISCIHPLFVSTFHSLPGYASYSFLAEEANSKWQKLPLADLFDLLIVDEAGQVSPEVGVYAFGLAKKALVVGDSLQIEPIWAINSPRIDYGNLQDVDILPKGEFLEESYDQYSRPGILACGGSLINLAGFCSVVRHPANSPFPGTLLTEHRRCLDEIIKFSNSYVYNGLLEPMVGSSPFYEGKDSHPLPPLGYINIRGQSQTGPNGSSRLNEKEAKAIALWIKQNWDSLMQKGKKIEDVLAVVTPFKAQKNTIIKELKALGIKNSITVGTVHSLQGAERDYILFSPVYGTNELKKYCFFDRSYNMLNVTLTRAKKSFIVIGCMGIFQPGQSKKPSSGLASILFSQEEYALSSAFYYDHHDPSGSGRPVDRISSLRGHRKALARAFEVCRDQIVIVSPFISSKAIEDDNLIPQMKQAQSQGVTVKVFTDWKLDSIGSRVKPHAQKGRKMLKDNGIELILKKGIHNKSLIIDDKILIEGSFNWLSAVRDENSPHHRYESSIVLKDEKHVKEYIKEHMEELEEIETIS